MQQTSYFRQLRVFDGQHVHAYDYVAIHPDGRLFTGRDVIPDGVDIMDGSGLMLIPALLDLQIYGAGGQLFAEFPTAEALDRLVAHNRAGGTAGCLVTIATQPMPVILKCLEAVRHYLAAGHKGILGMHLEGPFIHFLRRGAHVAEWIIKPDKGMVREILAAAGGSLKMVTLAPECVDDDVLALFTEAGVVISAGHSNATFAEGMQFARRGVRAVTHLFNAMSPLHHRDTGLPGAAFLSEGLMASIIPDGIHVDVATLQIAKKMMGDRLFFITDAVTNTQSGRYRHEERTDRYTLPDGTLSGSAISLLQGVNLAHTRAGIPLEECLRMASLYPAKLMGWQDRYGSITPGQASPMVLVDEALEVQETYGC